MRTTNRPGRTLALSLALCALAGLSSGCATPKHRITGKVTQGGKPLEWASDEGVLEVTFAPLDREGDKKIYVAETDRKTGTYKLASLPAGTYRVAISQMDPYPTFDLLGVQYGLHNSPLVREVKGDAEMNIDLPGARPKGGKKSGPKRPDP